MKIDKVYDIILNKDLIYTIGENAIDNWNIIDAANKHDIWFHVQNSPSCHIILHLDSKNDIPSKQTLIHCASICKYNSKVANNKNVKIIYTNVFNVHKTKQIGSVITHKTKIIII